MLALAVLLPAPAGAATALSIGTTFATEVGFEAQSCTSNFCIPFTENFERSFDFVVPVAGSNRTLTVNAASQVAGSERLGTLFVQTGVVLERVRLHAPDTNGTYLPIADATLTRSVTCLFTFGNSCTSALFDYDALLIREPFDLEAFRLTFQGSARARTAFQFDVTVSQVPVPAAAWLLLGGLGMLGAAARRRAGTIAE